MCINNVIIMDSLRLSNGSENTPGFISVEVLGHLQFVEILAQNAMVGHE